MFDRVVTIDQTLFNQLKSFLTSGKVETGGLRLDLQYIKKLPLSFHYETDNVSIEGVDIRCTLSYGRLTFEPRLKAIVDVKGLKIAATVSEARLLNSNTIYIEIDNSPIDLLLKSK